MQTGIVTGDNGVFGVISTPNSGGGHTEVIVAAASCKGFNGEIPPRGTAVKFTLRLEDQKLIADNVWPVGGAAEGSDSSEAQGDTGGAGYWPELAAGTRVLRDVQQQHQQRQLQWPELEGYRPQATASAAAAAVAAAAARQGALALPGLASALPGIAAALGLGAGAGMATPAPSWESTNSNAAIALATGAPVGGTMKAVCAGYGFITQDDGIDVFVLPQACLGFQFNLPPPGTRVRFMLTGELKAGKVKAENVVAEGSEAGVAQYLAARAEAHASLGSGENVGTVSRSGDDYGFIMRADGTEILAMARSCKGFGSRGFPDVGTRVKFRIVADEITGQARAESVVPLMGQPEQQPAPAPWLVQKNNGAFYKDTGKHGIIKQDDGNEIYVLPNACKSWNKAFPPVGTRVTFDIATDEKTGKTRAANVEHERPVGRPPPIFAPVKAGQSPAAALVGPYHGTAGAGSGAGEGAERRGGQKKIKLPKGYVCGTVARLKEDRFGFIVPDDGHGGEMFVVPSGCRAFGGNLPAVGTRVQYRIVPDDKSGKFRADDVAPLPIH